MVELDRFTGCLIGGGIGDALGYPIEFLTYDQIVKAYGIDGVTAPLLDDRKIALISDDTQMTLFTVEGLLWAKESVKRTGQGSVASKCFYSYQRWLHTQSYPLAEEAYEWILDDDRLEIKSPLLKCKELYERRAPGTTCLQSLMHAKNQAYGTREQPINNSKGCGGVMRVAPVGLAFYKEPKRAFNIACDVAAITHSNPTGYYSAGVFAATIAYLLNGLELKMAVNNAISIATRCPGSSETVEAVEKALELVEIKRPCADTIRKLGEGFVAEEALAIAIYCALSFKDSFKESVLLAVNHDGDSDSTGAICGNLLGASLGLNNIPYEWLIPLELKETIYDMGSRLYDNYIVHK